MNAFGRNSLVKMNLRLFQPLSVVVTETEAVQKIATDKKDDHKCFLCVIFCCIVKIYQLRTMNKIGY